MKTNAFKVELLIINCENVKQEDLEYMLENVKYLYPKIMSIESREIDFHDDHPLNKHGEVFDEAYRELFQE